MSLIKGKKHTVTAAVFAAVAFPAAAQNSGSSPASLPAIKVEGKSDGYKADTVSSPKSTAPILNTPQSVSVIKEQVMKEQAATTLTEALRNSPGVGTFFLGENGNTSTGDAIYMRGSDASTNIFVDGIRDIGTISRDVFNIQQVEVLKGAAGAQIGRGSATGAINLVTNRPNLRDSFSGTLGAGTADFKRATVDWNKKLSDTSAFRLDAMVQDSGVDGRDRIKNKREGIAPQIAFGLNTPTRVYLNYLHVKQNNIPDGGVFTIGMPGYSSPDPARPFLSTAPRASSSNFYGTKDDHDNVTSDMLTLNVEHTITQDVTLRNVTRWGKTKQDYQLGSFLAANTGFLTPNVNDPSTWTISRNINNKNVENEIITNQTNLSAKFKTGAFQHTVSTGVELIREKQHNNTYVGTGAYPALSAYNPNADVSGYTRAFSGAYTQGQTDTVGLYAFDTLILTPAWQVTGGLRYDHYKTHYNSVTAAGVGTPLNADGHILSGMLGLVFKPTEDTSLYVSYAETKQPPGGANFSLSVTNPLNVNNPSVAPQVAKTIEGGAKWDLMNGNLSLTSAIYQTKYADQILQDTDGSYYRAGDKKVEGIELAAVGKITNAWSITAGAATMHTKVTSPNNVAVTADGSSVLAYSPTASATLWTTYDLPNGITIGGGALYNGKMKRGSDGAIGTPAYVDPYVVFNAMASYRVNKNWTVQLNVFNLFDKDYVASINKSGYRYTPGAPRSGRITASFTF